MLVPSISTQTASSASSERSKDLLPLHPGLRVPLQSLGTSQLSRRRDDHLVASSSQSRLVSGSSARDPAKGEKNEEGDPSATQTAILALTSALGDERARFKSIAELVKEVYGVTIVYGERSGSRVVTPDIPREEEEETSHADLTNISCLPSPPHSPQSPLLSEPPSKMSTFFSSASIAPAVSMSTSLLFPTSQSFEFAQKLSGSFTDLDLDRNDSEAAVYDSPEAGIDTTPSSPTIPAIDVNTNITNASAAAIEDNSIELNKTNTESSAPEMGADLYAWLALQGTLTQSPLLPTHETVNLPPSPFIPTSPTLTLTLDSPELLKMADLIRSKSMLFGRTAPRGTTTNMKTGVVHVSSELEPMIPEHEDGQGRDAGDDDDDRYLPSPPLTTRAFPTRTLQPTALLPAFSMPSSEDFSSARDDRFNEPTTGLGLMFDEDVDVDVDPSLDSVHDRSSAVWRLGRALHDETAAASEEADDRLPLADPSTARTTSFGAGATEHTTQPVPPTIPSKSSSTMAPHPLSQSISSVSSSSSAPSSESDPTEPDTTHTHTTPRQPAVDGPIAIVGRPPPKLHRQFMKVIAELRAVSVPPEGDDDKDGEENVGGEKAKAEEAKALADEGERRDSNDDDWMPSDASSSSSSSDDEEEEEEEEKSWRSVTRALTSESETQEAQARRLRAIADEMLDMALLRRTLSAMVTSKCM